MNRGQAYTLEGIVGAIVIASALVIGLQAVDPAPWTEPDPTNPEELRTQVQDALDAASDRDALAEAVRCTDGTGAIHREGFMEGTALQRLLANTVATGNYRISVEYLDGDERVESVVVSGRPGRTSATATRQVALFDSDAVLEYDGEECRPLAGLEQPTLVEDDTFYIDEQHPDAELYAVVTIRVVVW